MGHCPNVVVFLFCFQLIYIKIIEKIKAKDLVQSSSTDFLYPELGTLNSCLNTDCLPCASIPLIQSNFPWEPSRKASPLVMDAVLTSLNLGRTNSSRITNSEKWMKNGSSQAKKQLLLPSFLLALLGIQ